MPRRLASMLVALLLLLGPGVFARSALADDRVDVLLVLAADISRSVDDRKFRLQRDGYAAAIADPRVVRAMAGGPMGRIGLCFVEWAGDGDQTVVMDWTSVGTAEEAEAFARRVRDAPRAFMGRTSISAAIDYGVGTLERSPFLSERRVIDVSGDGTNNSGGEVTVARDDAIKKGITINGLVILSDVPLVTNPKHTHPDGGLTAYYENNVIGGPGAFVLEAENFESFGRMLVSKLVREIASLWPRATLAAADPALD